MVLNEEMAYENSSWKENEQWWPYQDSENSLSH